MMIIPGCSSYFALSTCRSRAFGLVLCRVACSCVCKKHNGIIKRQSTFALFRRDLMSEHSCIFNCMSLVYGTRYSGCLVTVTKGIAMRHSLTNYLGK